jgi:hypothetical protein
MNNKEVHLADGPGPFVASKVDQSRSRQSKSVESITQVSGCAVRRSILEQNMGASKGYGLCNNTKGTVSECKRVCH